MKSINSTATKNALASTRQSPKIIDFLELYMTALKSDGSETPPLKTPSPSQHQSLVPGVYRNKRMPHPGARIPKHKIFKPVPGIYSGRRVFLAPSTPDEEES